MVVVVGRRGSLICGSFDRIDVACVAAPIGRDRGGIEAGSDVARKWHDEADEYES